MKSVSGKKLVQILKGKGWYLDRIKGSHHIMKKDDKDFSITVPVHRDKDLRKGTLNTIMKAAELTDNDF